MTRAFLAVIALFAVTTVQADTEFYVKTAKPGAEQNERAVDEAASASQERAISKLTILLKKYRGTRQEPILLSKLGDLQQQYASIIFRIAHGHAHRQKTPKPVDLTRYSKAMQQSISTLNNLITSYPNFEEIPHAYFIRAKAYEELSAKDSATRDYLFLVKNFPNAEETPSAYMSLAEFAIAANDHPKAITYLNEVEKLPEDSHFPFALYKLAWSHYNLKNIPMALSFAERHIEYYRKLQSASLEKDSMVTSDVALMDNTLLDVTVFYLEGYEQNLQQYKLTEALPYFRKIESGPGLGKMLLRFAKLLRSHGHDSDLIAWKNQILDVESSRPEAIDVLIITYEHQLNKRKFAQLVDSSRDIVTLYKKHPEALAKLESFTRAQKLLLDTAESLQAVILKNKQSEEIRPLSVSLASIYDSFTRVVPETDPRVPRVHYNLAETLFAISDFSGATEHYRWVVDHSVSGAWNKKEENAASVSDASLKAIAARYEVLNQRQLIPKNVTARPLQKNSDRSLDPLLAQWIDWIDFHVKKVKLGSVPAQIRASTENFMFEANRALYAQDHIVQALERFKTFAQDHPESTYAIPSASLTVDTQIASNDWKETHELANEFMKVSQWKSHEFSKKLFAVAADAYYKLIEAKYQAQDYKGVIKDTDRFLKQYATSARLPDCLSLSARSGLALNDKELALQHFSRLITDAPQSESVASALIARATIEEERYQLDAAATDYKAYLSLPPQQLKIEEGKADALRKKVLTLMWVSGDIEKLRAVLNSKSICSESLTAECEKFSVLALLSAPDSKQEIPEEVLDDIFEKTKKASGETRTLYASLALGYAKKYTYRDRLYLLRQATNGWAELDPLVRYSLLSRLSESIPTAFRLNRSGMREVAPLRSDEKYITRRIEAIKELENTATKVLKLPWSRIRAEVMNEIAALYLDLSRELAKLPPPKNLTPADVALYDETIRKLVLPFEEKGQELRSKAFEIASRNSIEDKSFNAIAEPFFLENPSQAKALKPITPIEKPDELTIKFIAKIDPSSKWEFNKFPGIDEPAAVRIKAFWAKALAEKRWPQIAFFMQEAQEKKILEPGFMAAVKAVSLATAGARGEALAEIDEAKKELTLASRTVAMMTLVHYYFRSCARDKTKELLKDIQADQLDREQASLVAFAKAYAIPAAPSPVVK